VVFPPHLSFTCLPFHSRIVCIVFLFTHPPYGFSFFGFTPVNLFFFLQTNMVPQLGPISTPAYAVLDFSMGCLLHVHCPCVPHVLTFSATVRTVLTICALTPHTHVYPLYHFLLVLLDIGLQALLRHVTFNHLPHTFPPICSHVLHTHHIRLG